MTNDPKARELTLNYAGGSLTMTRGALESLFGEDAGVLTPVPETKQVTVKSHQRVAVIGGPSSTVTGFSYELTQWPTSQANNAAAGEVVLLSWDGSGGNWTGRVSGSMSALGIFLVDTSTKAVVFRTERGTKYGPFEKAS
jgi:hypothetical protein